MKYSKVRLDEAKEPTGISGSASAACMCCGRVLSGMGGGGLYLCSSCLKRMESGDMADALRLLDDRERVA